MSGGGGLGVGGLGGSNHEVPDDSSTVLVSRAQLLVEVSAGGSAAVLLDKFWGCWLWGGGSWPSSCSLQSLDLLISSTLPPAEPLNCCHFLPPSIFKRLEFSGSRGSAVSHSVRISLEILKHILNFFFSFVHAAAPNINTKSDHMAPTRAAIRAASQGR